MANSTQEAFHEVRSRRNSKEPRLRQANIVLDAVTEVIAQQYGAEKKQGGDFPLTAYFAALMSFLERRDSEGSMVAAIMFLLGKVLKHVSPAVLRSRSERVATLMCRVLTDHSEEPVACRWGIECGKMLLASLHPKQWAQSNKAAQKISSQAHLFRALLLFATDLRPRIRKSAQAGVADILEETAAGTNIEGDTTAIRPAMNHLGSIVKEVLVGELQQCTPKECQGAMFACGLLQKIIHVLPPAAARSVLDKLFELAAKGSPVLLIQSMKTAESLFSEDPNGSGDPDSKQSRSGKERDLQNRLILDSMDTVLAMRPHVADVDANLAYLKALLQGARSVCNDSDLIGMGGLSRVAAIVSTIHPALISPKGEVVKASATVLRAVMAECVPVIVDREAKAGTGVSYDEIVGAVVTILSYRYKTAWQHAFAIASSLLRKVDVTKLKSTARILLALDSLHQGTLSNKERKYLESAIEAAIMKSGIEAVLDVLPLELPTTNCNAIRDGGTLQSAFERSRSWLLPVMQSAVKNGPHRLAYFFQVIWPQLEEMEKTSNALPKIGKEAEAKMMAGLVEKIWECFPSFCVLPTDMYEALGKYAMPWAKSIQSRKDDAKSCGCICKGLASFVGSVSDGPGVGVGGSAEEDEDDDDAETKEDKKGPGYAERLLKLGVSREDMMKTRKLLGKYSGNFLPLLFSAALSGPRSPPSSASGVHIVAAVTEFGRIADSQLTNKLFLQLLKRMLKAQTSATASEAMMEENLKNTHVLADLAIGLVPHLNKSALDWGLKAFLPMLEDDDPQLQKKAYRIIRLLCEPGHASYVQGCWRDLSKALRKALACCLPGVTRTRLSCMEHFVPTLLRMLPTQPDTFQELGAYVGEIILSCKESNSKARESAFALTVTIGTMLNESEVDVSKLKLLSSPDPNKSPLLCEYLAMVSGGLAGTSPRMQGAAVSVLARLIYEFHDDIPRENITKIIRTVSVLLRERNREVVKAVIGFCKVVCIRADNHVLKDFLGDIVTGLCRWSDDQKNRFRQKIRSIFVTLSKRYGSETLSQLVPAKHRKLVDHIRKEVARKARDKAESWKEHQSQFEGTRTVDFGTQEGSAGPRSRIASQNQRDIESVLFDEKDEDEDADFQDFRRTRRSKKKAGRKSMAIVDPDVDFMGPGVSELVVRGGHTIGDDLKRLESQDVLAFGDDGKLIIPDENQEKNMDEDGEEGARDGKEVFAKKRKKRKQVNRDNTRNIQSGKRFKSRKGAGGDVKTKSTGVDPYAYVPMNPAHLNKRKFFRAKKAFESVVSKSGKGGKNKGMRGKRGGQKRR